MPRDNWCSGCGGNFDNDDMGEAGLCIYCEAGADSGFQEEDLDA